MLLFFALVAFSCVGFSTGVENRRICYGRQLFLPTSFNPQLYKGPIYFTPRGKGQAYRRTIMDNGQPNHPRLKVGAGPCSLTDLRETDDGIYSVSFGGNRITDIIDLEVLDCADDVTRTYWHALSINVPRDAHYLEFTPLSGGEATVLWNRTGSQAKKDKVQFKWNVIDVFYLTQADNGYYNLRKKDNTLMKRKRLQVEATELDLSAEEDERLYIKFPFTSATLSVTYIRDGESEEHTLIDNGITVRENSMHYSFRRRFYKLKDSFEINPVERNDGGTFYFKDQNGNLAHTVRLRVENATLPTYVYIIVPILAILLLICCCCCVKKCCCKKSSSKRTKSEPAVQYQSPDQTQPSVPYYGAPATLISYQPAKPDAPAGPAPPYSTGPPAAAPSQPTASPAAFSAQPNFLSTDVEPTFELKGSNFPSAPLFSSDSTSADVYTSDKLNFL